LYHKL